MTLTKDTPLQENAETDPNDPHKTASGSAESPGGAATGNQTMNDLTQGQESYPGDRKAGENNSESTTGR